MPGATPSRDEWPRLVPRLPSAEDLRSSLWFWPALAAVLGTAVGTALGTWQPATGSLLGRLAWPGDHDSAAAFLQVVAGSVITVTSLTFSLVVVTLQLASQQFSPRLLREFARDLATQLVLGVLVTTFVVAVTVLRSLDKDEDLPSLALGLVFLLVLLSISSLLGFLGHITRLVRVDTMMAAVHRQTRQALDAHYLPYGAEQDSPDLPADTRRGGAAVHATRSGFLQVVHVDALVRAAAQADGLVVLGVRPGDHVTVGTPVARVLAAADREPALRQAVRDGLELGYERTLQQDVALGVRQLTDIAVKALSPGINDPTTAGHAVGHLSDLLVRLVGRRLGPVVHADDRGAPRLRLPDHDLRFYLDLVVAPIRRYGAGEPTVLVALLRMLRDVAVAAVDDSQRDELHRQVGLVEHTVAPDLLEEDAEGVRQAAEAVRQALAGDVLEAFEDRAGETRSL